MPKWNFLSNRYMIKIERTKLISHSTTKGYIQIFLIDLSNFHNDIKFDICVIRSLHSNHQLYFPFNLWIVYILSTSIMDLSVAVKKQVDNLVFPLWVHVFFLGAPKTYVCFQNIFYLSYIQDFVKSVDFNMNSIFLLRFSCVLLIVCTLISLVYFQYLANISFKLFYLFNFYGCLKIFYSFTTLCLKALFSCYFFFVFFQV